VRGAVGGELVSAGGQIEVSSSALISGDVTVAGGQLLLDGVTNGNVVARGGTVAISGKVFGTTNIDAGEVSIHRTAVLADSFLYTSPKEATIAEGASFAQPPVFTKRAGGDHDGRGAIAAVIGGWWLLKLLMTLVVGYVLYYLFRPRIEALALDVHEHLATRALHGLAALFVIPAVCVLLMMIIVAIPLGIVGIALYAIMLVMASCTAGIAFGSVLDKYIWKRPDGMITWQSVGIGIILLKLIQLIPVVGWIIGLIFFAFAFGYHYDSFSRWFKLRNQPQQNEMQQTLLS
jgi:cytoskeletal protein CcmA (bactofilin family)